MTTLEIMQNAKRVKNELNLASTEQKNLALSYMAQALIDNKDKILEANRKDVENADGRISAVMIDRLRLNEKRIEAMAQGIIDVSRLDDPNGKILSEITRADGLNIKKVMVPMGVIAIIYESRPNVTSDAAALAVKSGNVCVLRSGKDAFLSANAIVEAMQSGIERAGMSRECVQLVQDTTRQSSGDLMHGVGYIDLLIPRGGAGLISACVENAKVPTIQTGTGICHVYVDKDADVDKALSIIENAKTSRPSVCNAAEVCLVHSDIAEEFLPKLYALLTNRENPVELRLCEKSRKIIPGKSASDTDFDTEFLDYILAVKIVESLEEAIEHISAHSTMHSEAIVTENRDSAEIFKTVVDSSSVYINASTRFTDGGEFGKGCEMGISTQKLHARGPMGLEELMTYKYVIAGNGHIRR